MITKAERAELRSIVRGQFKVLRAEVLQRRAELVADVEGQISDRYAGEDKTWADAANLAYEVVNEANRRINDIYRQHIDGDEHVERQYITGALPHKPTQQRQNLRHEAITRIDAQVEGAQLRLAREEADMLRNLAVGALESEEARAFLANIPSVASLVPAARLAELESSFPEGD